MTIKYFLCILALLTAEQSFADDFGSLTKSDELYCRVDTIFPKKNADKDGCVF